MGYRRKTSNAEKKTGCFAITEQPSSIPIGMTRIVNIIIRNGITISRELYLKQEERVSDNRKRVSINRNVTLTIENVPLTIGTCLNHRDKTAYFRRPEPTR